MRPRVGRRLAIGLALLAGLAPGDGASAPADAGPRAALIVDDAPLAVGVVGEVVVAVRTPIGHRVLPIAPPPLAGAEIVGTSVEVREHPGGGWLHRTHLRLRPLEDGPLRWPAIEIDVAAPDGERERLALPERVLEVGSVMRPAEDDRPPFGLVAPEHEATATAEPLVFAAGAALGAGGALACSALVARRRRRRAAPAPEPGGTDEATPMARGDETPAGVDPLACARAALDRDPRRAAGLAAAALRRLVSDRCRVDLRAATTEELREARPAAAPPELFDELVHLIERHDASRFPDHPVDPARVARDVEQSAALAARWPGAGERAR
jgi:hypothetical protein